MSETLYPLHGPLPAIPPATWTGRLDRVAWVNANLTRGEKAELYPILNRDGITMATAHAIAAGERKDVEAKLVGRWIP